MPELPTSAADRAERIGRNLEEVLVPEDLRALLDSGTPLKHYIGFEISGAVHLGTGLVGMAKVADLQAAGAETTVLLADWHTWINDKLGGDREVIREVAAGYFAEALKASLACAGGDPGRLTFVLGSDLYASSDDYWATVVEVGKHTSLARMQRSISIMGRREGESVDFAKLLYPAMQVADIFVQGVNLAHAGMDQRKAHVIARDVALQLRRHPLRDASGEQVKPVALHHPLLLGLKRPPVWPVPASELRDVLAAMKMSKSDPMSAVFVHDEPDEIRDKIRRAFCPPAEVTMNPVLNWAEQLVFRIGGGPLTLERAPQHGGPVTFATYAELATAYADGKVHPMDLKAAVAEWLVDRLAPARAHFATPGPRAGLERLHKALAAS